MCVVCIEAEFAYHRKQTEKKIIFIVNHKHMNRIYLPMQKSLAHTESNNMFAFRKPRVELFNERYRAASAQFY